MQLKIRHKLFVLLSLLSLSLNAQADISIETVKDIRVLKQQIESAQLPALLMFTSVSCDYCESIRQNYLLPMIRLGQYKERVLFRQLYIDSFKILRDESGELVGGDQFGLKYSVEYTPTIVFINAQGEELAQRIVGISAAAFFDTLLDTQITKALEQFKSGS